MPELLTPKEIAEILKVSYESALAFVKYSGIDFLKIGNQYRVSKEKLNAFLRQQGSVYVDISGV